MSRKLVAALACRNQVLVLANDLFLCCVVGSVQSPTVFHLLYRSYLGDGVTGVVAEKLFRLLPRCMDHLRPRDHGCGVAWMVPSRVYSSVV